MWSRKVLKAGSRECRQGTCCIWGLYCSIFYRFFGGLEFVCHSFAYVAHFVFLRDVWLRTQRAGVASRRANNLATHLAEGFLLYNEPQNTPERNLCYRQEKEDIFIRRFLYFKCLKKSCPFSKSPEFSRERDIMFLKSPKGFFNYIISRTPVPPCPRKIY